MKKLKKGFSLIELIFIIAVLAIIAAVAVPKFMDTKSNALAASLKQDISTITTAIQSYYMLNSGIDDISDAVTLDSQRWDVKEKKAIYNIDSNDCITIEVSGTTLLVSVESNATGMCKKILDFGISTQSLDLY